MAGCLLLSAVLVKGADGFIRRALCRSLVAAGSIQIGERVQINDSCHIAAVHSVRIDDDVLIESRVFIADHDHVTYSGGAISTVHPRWFRRLGRFDQRRSSSRIE